MNPISHLPSPVFWAPLLLLMACLLPSPAHAQLGIPTRPVIVQEPENRTTDPGATVTFTVEARSFLALRYQWQKLGETPPPQWEDIPGATAATLTLSDVSLKEVGQYRVVVRNNIGARLSEVVTLRFRGEPQILSPPQNQSVSLGPEIEFSVFVNGTAPFAYQWSRNGEPIAGATADRLLIKTEQLSPTRLKLDIGGLQTAEVAINDQQLATGGVFTVEVRNALGQVTSPPATLEVDTTFTKITDEPMLECHWLGGWADYDGDGYLDVFSGALSESPLWHNDGRGHFTPAYNSGLPPWDENVRSWSWGDYDNDGHPDLYIVGRGGNALCRNQGNGTFTRVPAAGVEGGMGGAELVAAATWVDYDKDGNLDLFVATGGQQRYELHFLYHSRGDGSFERVTVGAIANERSGAEGAAWADYDDDGNLDLFVPNAYMGPENDFLYRNNGDGTFSQVTGGPVVNDAAISFSSSWGDFNGDGLLDLFVGASGRNLLYRNLGAGEFVRITEGPVVTDGQSFGDWGDYDNDGNLDLVTASSLPYFPNTLYRNQGDGTFKRIFSGSPNNDLGSSIINPRWVDIDNDGHLDLFFPDWQGTANLLYRNNGNSNHWLHVKCRATVSNQDASGARIRVCATIEGKRKWQLREVTGGADEHCVRTQGAHFGLGNATRAEVVRLEWPSGVVQELQDVPVDQILTVREPEQPVTIQPRLAAAEIGATVAFTTHTDWPGPLTYQWQKYGQEMPLPGETNDTLRIENVQATDYGRFLVLVERAGATERVGALVALEAPAQPVILWQPRRPEVELGGEARFEVQATGTPPLSYQWQKDGVVIPGATGPVLVIHQFQDQDAGEYVVRVRNPLGEAVSQTVRIGVPEIEDQPASQSVSLGASVGFVVQAAGFGPLSYQWQRDGQDIPGATNASFTLAEVSGADHGSQLRVTVANRLGTATSQEANLAVDPTFRKLTHNPIVEDMQVGWSVAWGDYDSDGNQDLFLPRMNGYYAPFDNHLYRNHGDGTFTPITEGQIVHDGGISASAAWGDYNNDGNLDLSVVNFQDRGPDFLYENQGDGSFQRDTRFPPEGAVDLQVPLVNTWIDYDNDGWLDLFVTTYFGERDALYRNQGDGTFLPVTDSPLVTDSTWAIGAAWADIDDDGYLDLFVSCLQGGFLPGTFQPARLFKNNRDGTFTRLLDSPLVKDDAERFSAEWADYDNDGRLDLFVAIAGPNFLFHNEGDWRFTPVTNVPMVADLQVHASGAWGDYDNDGNLDLFVANGGVFSKPETNALFHNEGNGRFTRVLAGSLVNELNRATESIWVDYDNDGFLDLFVGVPTDSVPPLPINPRLFQNNLRALGNTNGWIKIKLVGTYANRSGIGARLRMKATIRGKEVRQLRQMVGGASKGNTSTLVAHFGLGDAPIIDEIRIEWPGPKFTRQVLYNVAVSQSLTITEPGARPMLTAAWSDGLRLTLQGEVGATYVIMASPDLASWMNLATLSVTNPDGTITYLDPESPRLGQRFYRAMKQP